jgi:hypothetical protein
MLLLKETALNQLRGATGNSAFAPLSVHTILQQLVRPEKVSCLAPTLRPIAVAA